MTRQERLSSAVVWTSKDVRKEDVVEGVVRTLEEQEGKRRPGGRGLKLPYLRDDLNPDAEITVRCAACGWSRVTKDKFRAEVWASHLESVRHARRA